MSSVRVRLITRDDSLKVDDSPLYVPVDLKRYGLSEVVNQLLSTETPIPFDFVIDGKLLRSSLDKYLTEQGLSTESVLTVEYVRSVLPPTFVSSFAHDDWVSSVDINDASQKIVTGSYDGVVRLWDFSGNVTDQLAGHTGAVKSIQWVSDSHLVSAGADRNLCLWKLGDEKAKIACIFQGHTGPVNSTCTLASGKIISGSSDGTLKVWSTRVKELPEAPEAPTSTFTSTKKRRKLAEQALISQRVRGSLATLEGHTAPVTGLAAHSSDANVVYSVSEDHTLRTWDLVTDRLIDTKATAFSLLSVANMGPTTSLIACGSSARHISLIDPRTKTTTSQAQLIGHRNFVVDLAVSPNNPYMLASASHDGTTRLWDVRANKSMYTVARNAKEDNDVYCVAWKSVLAAGGKDKKLEITQVPNSELAA
ncbi:Ribosome biogenesis protein YTM1 [Wickerhamiella sorbophila]|uniref:Ribosome biogenesis protein YTM1 n=1 Tax=Wickerhamiella sorbophila TaxID=45607 RepID=A0A2T0FIQ4_9ASCO|nr:Ribosome biogenesis protein YTM1 [Wickerhamiella sorbophila]PRT54865.1 Ribosome biogenesis protein YTM1 [Wickerhamiella sorbophila]